jgi:hypothetical protein
MNVADRFGDWPDKENDVETAEWMEAIKRTKRLIGNHKINKSSGVAAGYFWDREGKRIAYVYTVHHRGMAYIALEAGSTVGRDSLTVYSTRANVWRHHLRRIRSWILAGYDDA